MPELDFPPQTPNSSTALGSGQHSPPASWAPGQQAPVKSTTLPAPLQAPHASKMPLQQAPELSSVALAPAQQDPSSLTTPAPGPYLLTASFLFILKPLNLALLETKLARLANAPRRKVKPWQAGKIGIQRGQGSDREQEDMPELQQTPCLSTTPVLQQSGASEAAGLPLLFGPVPLQGPREMAHLGPANPGAHAQVALVTLQDPPPMQSLFFAQRWLPHS